jgi:chromosome segregation ATPase
MDARELQKVFRSEAYQMTVLTKKERELIRDNSEFALKVEYVFGNVASSGTTSSSALEDITWLLDTCDDMEMKIERAKLAVECLTEQRDRAVAAGEELLKQRDALKAELYELQGRMDGLNK